MLEGVGPNREQKRARVKERKNKKRKPGVDMKGIDTKEEVHGRYEKDEW